MNIEHGFQLLAFVVAVLWIMIGITKACEWLAKRVDIALAVSSIAIFVAVGVFLLGAYA